MKKYYGPKGIQALDAIEAWNLGFHLGMQLSILQDVVRKQKILKEI